MTTEKLIYLNIKRCINQNGYAPTFRELSEDIGISISTIHHHMRKMKERGIITYIDKMARTTKILEAYHE